MQYTEEELQKILEDHKLWLSGEGGKRADFWYANLSNADLRCSDLTNADLRCSDLTNANLSRADLRCANLRYSDLSHANLTGANLSGADLSHANLTGAYLSGATFFNATFSNTLIWGEPVNKAPLQVYGLPYNVLITDTIMQIGCQTYSIDEWLAFTVKEINEMDCNAKEFYKNYRKLIKAAVLSHRVPKEENKES